MWPFLRGFLLQTLVLATAWSAVASDDDDRLDTRPLVRIATRYGVPMPPPSAPLVLAATGRNSDVYSPAFLLEARGDGSAIVLRGFRREALSLDGRRNALWHPFNTKLDRVDFHRVSTFICAVQLAARGDDARAQFLWKQIVHVTYWYDRRNVNDYPYDTERPELFLGHCILDDLRMAYLRPHADWREINRRRRSLVKEIPGLEWDARATIYGDLLETLRAKPPKEGSVEALLLDWSRRPHERKAWRFFDRDDGFHDRRDDAPARRIILRGFEAIPDLLNLVDDPRLTAHRGPTASTDRARQGVFTTQRGLNKDDPRNNLRLGDLAQQLLAEITGLRSPSHGEKEIAGWRTWWEKSRTQNEADVFAKAVFKREGRSITWVNEGPARILAQKYPLRLLSLFDEFARDGAKETQLFVIAEAMIASPLPRETKERVLVASAQQGSLESKRSVLQVLARLNAQKCAELLLPIVRHLPEDCDGPYWTCAAAHFTHVVMLVEDDEVWRAFLASARRSSVGLRLEFMNPMDYAYIRDKNRERRLAFLAAFLDDATVRRMGPRYGFGVHGPYDGPCAAFTFPEIEVRNFAAMELACILDICDAHTPDESWTSAQWSSFRTKVRAKLVGEKLPNLETPSTSN
jgi:hypothetical protein